MSRGVFAIQPLLYLRGGKLAVLTELDRGNLFGASLAVNISSINPQDMGYLLRIKKSFKRRRPVGLPDLLPYKRPQLPHGEGYSKGGIMIMGVISLAH